MKPLIEHITAHFAKKKPFVAYALPNSKVVAGLFQRDEQLHLANDLQEDGFVFAPFHEGHTILIPESKCLKLEFDLELMQTEPQPLEMEHDLAEQLRYEGLVEKALLFLRKSQSSKVVTSRMQEVPLKSLDLPLIVNRLMGMYSSAFRYVLFHPAVGIWAGASPETLLEIKENSFNTMALASTQRFFAGREPRWTRKEIDEQQVVADDIATKLHQAATVVKVHKTKNHRAGSLVHLRTDFTGVFKKGSNNISILVDTLHPTPAVCGTPRRKALEFILNNEGYKRRYYTGYLGVIDSAQNSSRLFVNLRCMQLDDQRSYLYVGGGITKESVAKLEWEETCNKLQTMLQVLAPLL